MSETTEYIIKLPKITINFDFTTGRELSYAEGLACQGDFETNCLDFFSTERNAIVIRKSGEYISVAGLFNGEHTNKEIKIEHNIHKMLVAGAFTWKLNVQTHYADEATLDDWNPACGHDISIPECPDCQKEQYRVENATLARLQQLEINEALYRADIERIWAMMPELRNTEAKYKIHEAVHEKLRQLETELIEVKDDLSMADELNDLLDTNLADAARQNDDHLAAISQLQTELADLKAKLVMAHGLVVRYRKETPLGNQPHMIAHKADEFINATSADVQRIRDEIKAEGLEEAADELRKLAISAGTSDWVFIAQAEELRRMASELRGGNAKKVEVSNLY